MPLDLVDRKILHLLQHDAAMTIKELAEKYICRPRLAGRESSEWKKTG